MKRFLILCAMIAPVLANAASSDVAWTPDTLNFVKNGYAEKGKLLAKGCAACHGENGVSTTPNTPSLAGQMATYTYKQLRDYVKKNRVNAIMQSQIEGLTEQESADLAVWFSTLPRPPATKADNQNLAKAEKMVSEGDGKRILPPCFVCHGTNGQGEKLDIPALAGQRADYIAQTLLDYKSKDPEVNRHNDIYGRMRLIAQQLSEQEIKDLGQYYQQMQ